MKYTSLEEIHKFHSTIENFKELKIDGTILEPAITSTIERYYAKYLTLLIENFPYILKNQLVQFFPVGQSQSYKNVNRLEEMYLLKNEELGNYQYLYPMKKLMKWYEHKQEPVKVFRKRDMRYLMTSFMKVEYFLKTGKLIYDSDHFFKELLWFKYDEHYLDLVRTERALQKEVDEYLKGIEQLKNSTSRVDVKKEGELEYRLKLSNERLENITALTKAAKQKNYKHSLFKYHAPVLKDLYKVFSNKKALSQETYDLDKPLDCYTFIKDMFATLKEKACFFENITFNKDNVFFEIVVIHHKRTDFSKYRRLINEINDIMYCIEGAKWSLTVLLENEELGSELGKALKRYITSREEDRKIGKNYLKNEDVKLFNTDIDRYLFSHNYDKNIDSKGEIYKKINEINVLFQS